MNERKFYVIIHAILSIKPIVSSFSVLYLYAKWADAKVGWLMRWTGNRGSEFEPWLCFWVGNSSHNVCFPPKSKRGITKT